MSDFEAKIQKAVEDRVIPGAVLLAKDKSGKLNYSKAVGFKSIEPGKEIPLKLDDVFPIMSMTKLLTAVMALQLIEEGRLGLDDEVTSRLPLLAQQQVLTGFAEDGTPQFVPREGPITVRHLLTHTTGLNYPADPAVTQWWQHTYKTGPPIPNLGDRPVEAEFATPLLSQPGEKMRYGTSMDWLGRYLEEITGKKLEGLLKERILTPLDLKDITWFPQKRPDLTDRVWPTIPTRDPASGKAVHSPALPLVAEHGFGGNGLHASITDYIHVLESLLKDDEKLLKRETAKLLFTPHLPPAARGPSFMEYLTAASALFPGYIPVHLKHDWGLAGLLLDDDRDDHRKRGFSQWGGFFWQTWFIDRESGVCGVFATCMNSVGDVPINTLVKDFQDFVYEKL